MSTTAVGKIVFSEEQIKQRIAEIGQMINQDYQGERLVIISVLKGSVYFLVDLTRHLNMPLVIDFLSIGVSPEAINQPGFIWLTKDLDIKLTDQHVLLVEDVIGTGLTLAYICEKIQSYQPASLKICALLDKPAGRLLTIPIDYCCFSSDLFLVGYGLDYHEEYRNLPHLAEHRREFRGNTENP